VKDQITVLAVTKMLSGMCLGGVSLTTGEWVRPVKEFGHVLPGDLSYADGSPIRPFDVVELSLNKHRPTAPHVEDRTCDFVRVRPTLVRRLSDAERLAFLDKHAEPQAWEDLKGHTRSLCLLDAQEAEAIFALDSYSGKYEAKLVLPTVGERPSPVTDIKWRALGRRLVANGGQVRLHGHQLRQAVGADRVYPAIGLSRFYDGKFWPLVVGVHCVPDYDVAIDYGNL